MSKENDNQSAADIYRQSMKTLTKKAKRATKDLTKDLKFEADVIKYMNSCEHLKIYFPGEFGTYRKLIIALLNKRINPHAVSFSTTTARGNVYILNYEHEITETGKIKSVPGTLAFYKASGDLVDLYKKSIDNEEFEIRAFAQERAKDAEARRRRSRGIVVSWGK